MSKHLALSLVLAATACAGGSKTAAPTAPTTPAAAEPAMLELGELKLVEANKDQALTIQADGTIVMPDGEGEGPLKLTRDGKLMKADQTVLQLMPDGTLQGPDGKPIEGTLSADGVITFKDQKISLDDNGTVLGSNSGASQMRFEGATTPGLKRTALFVLIALLGRAEPAPPPPPTERVAN